MGLNSRAIVRRLRAWHYGAPVTLGQTIHTHTAEPEDRLLLAFVKMGGETRPWAVMWKEGTKRPVFRFVPEPRVRPSVDEMAAELGEVLARHLRHPAFADRPARGAADLAPLRQIWVPNGAHLDMLHHFAYAYARRRTDAEHATELRLLGRTALFAFLEAQRPGQQLVMSASDVLRAAYDFPAEDVRQAHLGFLLAWLSARGDREQGLAAALDAERLPISTALLPDLERGQLSPHVEAYNDARRAGGERGMREAEEQIGALLRPELERRLALTEQAIDVVLGDPRPVNRGVATLVQETLETQWWKYVRNEANAIARGTEPWVDSPEADFAPRGGAARYFEHEASADRMFAALVHDDRELEAEAIATGRAFRGTITEIRDEGTGRTTIPVIVVEDPTPGPVSLRVGDGVCIVGHQQRSGRIRSIDTTHGGGIALTVEITNRKTAQKTMPWPHSMHAADERWIGHAVTLIGTSFADMTEKKASKVRRAGSAPSAGEWLIARRDRVGEAAEQVASVETTDPAIEEAVGA